MSINLVIEILKDILPQEILERIKQKEFSKVYKFIDNIEEIIEESFNNETEGYEVLNVLSNELNFEEFFPRKRIKAFKNNPQEFANAKCIDSHMINIEKIKNKRNFDPVTLHNLSDTYVLLKEYKNSFFIFYYDQSFGLSYNRSCLLEVVNPQFFQVKNNVVSLKYSERVSLFELYED